MNLKRLMYVVFALLVTSGAASVRLAAQTMTTGGVHGTVTNPKGAQVSGAVVELKNNAKGTVQTATTPGDGSYQFGLLDPGSYTITVTMTGFQPAVKVVTVPLGEPVVVDFKLSVQPLPAQVQAASLLKKQDGNQGVAFTRRQILHEPNPGEDVTRFAQLAPGAVMNTVGGTGNFAQYGMPATSNKFTRDGVDQMQPFQSINDTGATGLMLGTNEIQEVDISNNNYSGSVSELAGTGVNLITRSGGSTLHGEANYFWNTRILNANDFFNNEQAIQRPFDSANQWQGSLGGTIKPNKVFFFLDSEGGRVLIDSPATVVMPSPQFQAATLTNLQGLGRPDVAAFYSGILFGTLNGAPQSSAALDNQFPGQFTDSSGIVHTTGDGCGGFNLNPQFYNPAGVGVGAAEPCSVGYTTTQKNFTKEWLVNGRLDFNISQKDRMFVRIRRDWGNQTTYSDPISSAFNVYASIPATEGQLVWNHNFGSTAANQVSVSGQYVSAVFGPTSQINAFDAFPTTMAMADGTFYTTTSTPNPCVNAPLGSGLPILLGGQDCSVPHGQNDTQVQISDDFSKTAGRHTIKMGGQYLRLDVSDHNFGTLATGVLLVNSINDFYNGGQTGDSYTQSFPQAQSEPMAEYTTGGYIEDDFRYSDRLNLTVAVRAEHDSNPICRNLCFAQLSSTFQNDIGLGNNQSSLLQIPYNQSIKINQEHALSGLHSVVYEPRIGFAWQPKWLGTKTVLRGGGGLFYNMLPMSIVTPFAENPPFGATFTSTNDFLVTTTGATGSSIFSDVKGANTVFQQGFYSSETFNTILANDASFTPPSIFTAEGRTTIPQYQKWSLELQHQLTNTTLVSVSYVGNHGVHEPVVDNSANAYSTSTFGTLPLGQAPDPRFGEVTVLYSGGDSHYNGVTATVTHQISGVWGRGVIQGSYTYSHAMDDVSNGGFLPFSPTSFTYPQDPLNYSGNYGSADYDVRHSGSMNFVWNPPLREIIGKRGPNYLINGWEISGVVFARTGLPYSVVDGALSTSLQATNYFGAVIPQYISGPTGCRVNSSGPSCLAPPGTASTCLTAAACEFNIGAESAFSTGQRNFFRGPDFFNVDAAVMKSTSIPFWQGAHVILGVQAYNVLNHPNFGMPVNNAASPNFGEILATAGSPTSVLGSMLGGEMNARVLQFKAQFTF
ncbi:MAG TPA: carboxypeptidase-like regulatory domain-containing protein [Candidatus Acidoferrales bacterium]|nr:carboxypeptidase-like regulatory domain-containing protein [Candidatus Acidoferrales bacterium]